MKHNTFIVILILGFSSFSFSAMKLSVYPEPPHPCYKGCNQFMSDTLRKFQTAATLKMIPGVYSGECRHLAANYNPDTVHYAVVMIDQNPKALDQMYFSTIFSFFSPENEFASWGLLKSRQEMSPYWIDHGALVRSENSPTQKVIVNYDSGDPAYVYYLRQSLISNELYYITYAGSDMVSFCQLQPNPEQRSL